MDSADLHATELDALLADFTDRLRRGEQPSIEQFVRDYPQWSGEIRDLLPTIEQIEGLKFNRRAEAAPITGDGPGEAGAGQETQVRPIIRLPGNAPATDVPALFHPAQAPDELGWLGPYRIRSLLGTGGMGAVFVADDVRLLRTVALKVLLPAVAGDADARQRFLREARSAAAIEDDHIVSIFQVDEDRGILFIAMPLLKGCSLEDRLRSAAPLTVPEIVAIGRQIAQGLAVAHQHGLIHRDIKPANIWLEQRGDHAPGERVKLLDFGIARPMAADQSLTQSGVVVGTPAYMAPEQALGEAVDARCDLWGLGVVLYRMTTGQMPFPVGSGLVRALVSAGNDPPPPAQLNPAIPLGLSNLVMSLLKKDPAQRPASAQEVGHVLHALERDASLTQQRDGPAPVTGSPPAKAGKRRWTPLLLVTAGAVILGAGFLLWQSSRPGPRTDAEDPSKRDLPGSRASDVPLPRPPGTPAPPSAIAPFDAATAREHQAAWAKNLGVPVEYTNPLGMTFRLIPPGEFRMGSPADEPNAAAEDQPQHPVILTTPFYLGTTEVTRRQFQGFVEATTFKTAAETSGQGAFFNGKAHPSLTWRDVTGFHPAEPGDRHPVTCLARADIDAFCKWLAKQDPDSCYRLPTDAEWEYACRAGTTTAYSFGDDPDPTRAVGRGSGPLGDVARCPPNPFGMYDMHGNLWEWCFDGRRTYTSNPVVDPLGPLGAEEPRVVRGGAISSPWNRLRSASRLTDPPEQPSPVVGFRLVRTVQSPVTAARLADAPWQALFNGKDLGGWKYHPRLPGDWKVVDGCLVGSGRRGWLFSERGDYGTFHLRAEVQLGRRADSGIFFWTPFAIAPFMDGQLNPTYWHEVNVNNDAGPFTGSLDGQGLVAQVRRAPARADEWFVLEVIALGNRVVSKVNGSPVAQLTYPLARRGHVALQTPIQPADTVQFRKIEIKVLAEPAAPLHGNGK